jgi:hypothetical protein
LPASVLPSPGRNRAWDGRWLSGPVSWGQLWMQMKRNMECRGDLCKLLCTDFIWLPLCQLDPDQR